MTVLAGKRMLMTGGAGFLGRVVAAALEKRQVNEIIVRRSGEYDLTEQAAVENLYSEFRPQVVIRLADDAPYGIAKKSLLVMFQAYRAQCDLNGIYLLPVNLYGPGDNFDLESSQVLGATWP